MRSKPPRLAVLIPVLVCLPSLSEAQSPPRAAPVEVEGVRERSFVPSATVLGTTEPYRRSVVAAAIYGYVIDYPVDEGMRVKKGDVLVRLRDNILRLQLEEAKAALAETREQHENARRDLERAQALIKTDSVTEKDLDARATLQRRLALQITQAEARIAILKADIEKKTVTAPFDGQIVEEHTEVGEWVAQGGPVSTLVDISVVLVRVNVPERYVRFLKEGQEVPVWVKAAAADTPFSGTILSISDEGDPDSRTFPVRIEAKRKGELRAGMSATVEIPAGPSRDAVVVSKDAILMQPGAARGESYVFIVDENSQAQRRTVRTGASSESHVAILEGLQSGERVVTRGNERLQPGATVRIVGQEGTSS